MSALQETLHGTQPEIVVSVGTDLHLFDRLIDWVDDWLAAQDDRPSCLVQHGASRAPKHALGISRMSRSELLDLYAGAKIVIVQGGPGSILDAREVGALPIAVPRRPEKQEVVDGHQIAFTETMEQQGEAVAVHSEEQLRRSLEAALRNPELFQKSPRVSDPDAAALCLETEVRKMLENPQKQQSLKKAQIMLRSRKMARAAQSASAKHRGEAKQAKNPARIWARAAQLIQERLQP